MEMRNAPYKIDVPPTVANVAVQAKLYQGAVHGDAKGGEVDVEFRDVYHAASFANAVANALGWEMEIRHGDAIITLDQSVVITVFPGYTPTEL